MTDRPSSRKPEEEQQSRRTSFAADPDVREESFRLEDRRWTYRYQVRDWLILAAMILLDVAWMALVFLLEPGLR